MAQKNLPENSQQVIEQLSNKLLEIQRDLKQLSLGINKLSQQIQSNNINRHNNEKLLQQIYEELIKIRQDSNQPAIRPMRSSSLERTKTPETTPIKNLIKWMFIVGPFIGLLIGYWLYYFFLRG